MIIASPLERKQEVLLKSLYKGVLSVLFRMATVAAGQNSRELAHNVLTLQTTCGLFSTGVTPRERARVVGLYTAG